MSQDITELIKDLITLKTYTSIQKTEWDQIETSITRNETKSYINNLFGKSKPETSLRESFFVNFFNSLYT